MDKVALGALKASMALQHPPEILTSLLRCLEGTYLLSSLVEGEPKGLNGKELTFPEMHMAGQEKGGCFMISATNHIC